jgi:hypothetical protein
MIFVPPLKTLGVQVIPIVLLFVTKGSFAKDLGASGTRSTVAPLPVNEVCDEP